MGRRFIGVFTQTVLLVLCIGGMGLPVTLFAFETPLKTEEASPSEIIGTVTLILYGGNFSDDLKTVAVLDIEGDGYHFEPFAPDFDYRLKTGVPGKDAIATAENFVSFHNAFRRSQLSKIYGRSRNVIGFELRPLYRYFVYGFGDVLDINYWLKEDGKVKVRIRLIPELESARLPGFEGVFGGQK